MEEEKNRKLAAGENNKAEHCHQPVLLREVLSYLDPQADDDFVDCTVGLGGHALPILKKNKPHGKVLGIDWSKETLALLREKCPAKRLVLAEGNFSEVERIARENNFFSPQGILFDLGLSSWQIEHSGKGFSFKKEEPLIMRYGGSGLTAGEILNNWPQEELIRIFKEYGEERFARSLARAIIRYREKSSLKTTFDLIEAAKKGMPKRYLSGKRFFATRIFQALRIAVNGELENLSQGLEQGLRILGQGGKLAVVSFHSLEDRIVKRYFKEKSQEGLLEILTKKPLQPSEEEKENNFRSRSAKLRVARKITR